MKKKTLNEKSKFNEAKDEFIDEKCWKLKGENEIILVELKDAKLKKK